VNYIILNGKKSTLIKGLLIQSLPPITKPLIRTQIDVIDGRDGDIVTPLGYSSYDKQITVGLHGNYNVDSVISYFDSSGTVVFSDEPDKVYNYTIYAQIDFAKLIRYKTATITFHVQPFKQSLVEKEVEYKNNLLKVSDAIKTVDGVTAAITNGVITVSGTAAAQTEIYLPMPEVEFQPGSYVVNAYATGLNAQLCTMRLNNSSRYPFGGEIALSGGFVTTMYVYVVQTETFNYMYFRVDPGDINITVSLQIIKNSLSYFDIRNNGNIYSKPKLTVYGSGVVYIKLNGAQLFTVNIADNEYITIDSEKMDAYKGDVLKNRMVTGDYSNFVLPPGNNDFVFTGMVTKVTIENYSRWI